MTLYEYIMFHKKDYDVYDKEYDASITACHIDKVTDSYDAFCKKMMQKVSVVETVNDYTLVANWSELIRRNMEVFKSFTEKYWKRKYKNDVEEFIYQWITEIHSYFGGYVSDEFYNVLLDLADELEAV